jgi:hypothetical protein
MESVSVRVIDHLTARPWRKGTMEIMEVLEALRFQDRGARGGPGGPWTTVESMKVLKTVENVEVDVGPSLSPEDLEVLSGASSTSMISTVIGSFHVLQGG